MEKEVLKATEVTDFSQSAVDIYNLSKFQRSNQYVHKSKTSC